jgi:xylulokinase
MKDLGITSDKVVLFGGGSNSEIWRHIVADIFNLRIVTLNVKEGPAYGAAILAGVGSGIYKDVKEATDMIIREATETLPNKANVNKYFKYYKLYRSLYKDLKGDYRKLAAV